MCTSFPSVLVKCVSLVGFSLVMLIGPTIEVTAQTPSTPFVPYFGKNRVRHDNFSWHIYTTQHFEIYYYPELEEHLERVAGYAESAYQKVSGDLKHDLAKLVPMVLFKTHSEFSQQNIISSDIPEGVAAFAEPRRDRMVLPIDEPSDRLYGLIVHELTHQHKFVLIFRSRNKLIEINVLSPGGMEHFKDIGLPEFSDTVIEAIERKVEYKNLYGHQFTNREIACME